MATIQEQAKRELIRRQALAELQRRKNIEFADPTTSTVRMDAIQELNTRESVPDTKDNLFTRFGKQVYNVALAAPAEAVATKSSFGKLNTQINTLSALREDVQGRFGRGEPLTQKEVDFWSKTPGWGQILKGDFEAGVLPMREEYTTDESLQKLNQAAVIGKQKTAENADISASVSEASNLKEKAVDIVAGITGFVAQLAALKKAFPTLPQAAVWELQGQVTGAPTGSGAASYAAFNAPGKFIKGTSFAAKTGRVATESALLGSLNAVNQKIETGEIDATQILVAAGIPLGLRAAGASKTILKRAIKSGNTKVMKALKKQYPETLSPQSDFTVSQEGVTKATHKNIPDMQKAAWENKWAGRNMTKLNRQMKGLLAKSETEKNVKKLTQLADDMDKLDLEIESISAKNLYKASFKHLHKLAKKQRIDVPKGTTKTGLKKMLQGQQDIVETETGYAVRNLLSNNKAGSAWKVDKYKTFDEALEVFHNQRSAMYETVAMGGKKPTLRIMGEVGKTSQQATAPVATSATDKALLDWAQTAKIISKDIKDPAIKALRKRQATRGFARGRKSLAEGGSAWTAIKESVLGYKDKANIPDVTPPKLTEAQWEGYARKILKLYPGVKKQFQKTDTLEALDRLKKGKIPTERQFELLEPLFGEQTTIKLYEALVKHRQFSGWDIPMLTVQGLKSIFGLDIQVSRQASTAKWRHPILYKKAQVANARAYISDKYAIAARKKLITSPGYNESAKHLNYIGHKGYSAQRLEYFRGGFTELLVSAKFKNKLIDKSFGKALRAYGTAIAASERGASVGINSMMKGLWDKGMKDLQNVRNLTPAQREAWIANRAKTINTNMKILRSKNPKVRELQRSMNYLLFSPSVTASRPLSIKALLVNKGSRGYQAQVLASNIAGIALTTAIPAIIAQHQIRQRPDKEPDISGELNPLSSDWGKIRIKDEVFDFSGGDAPFYRTLARIGTSAYLYGQERVTGERRTSVAGRRLAPIGETLLRYGETRETALLGLGKTLATGKDFVGNDMPGYEALLRAITPEVITATVEAGLADGTWAAMAAAGTTANSVGVSTYPVRAANTRSQFRDFVANEAHGKRWNDLTQKEQIKLSAKHRKGFEKLDEEVRKERIDHPFDPAKIKEEERQSGKRITKMLTKQNRKKVEGVSVNISRRPKNFFLNDKRYQAYQESVARHLNERLSKVTLEGRSPRARKALMESAVKIAKAKAFNDVRKL